MKNNLNDEDLTYALDLSGRMVKIDSIPSDKRGLACECFCPKCKKPLVAKLGHDVPHRKKPHFAHHTDSDCHGSVMTALHLLAEQILEEKKAVMAPRYKSIPPEKIMFNRVLIENRVERKDLQPDVSGFTEDGCCINIEIRNTSEVDERKKTKIKESKITCLEIDVRGQRMEELENFLLNSTDKRFWINNPIYDKRILKALYGDEKIQYEKLSKYKNDERFEIKKEDDCSQRCVFRSNLSYCNYNEDRFYIDDVVYVICNREKREKSRIDREAILPKQNHKKQPINEDLHYLEMDINNQPFHEIFKKIREKGVIYFTTDSDDTRLEGKIERCQISNSSDGIVVLCKCNDRTWPYYVLTIWIEKEKGKLRYSIKNRSREMFKGVAIGKYEGAIKTFLISDSICEKDSHDYLFEETNYCPF